MAAWDNVTLPGPPAAPSYAAPLLNFAPIGDLANDYFKGTQQKRTLAQQNAFPEGLPRNPDGTPNIKEITDRMAKLQGAEGALPILKLGIAQQFLDQEKNGKDPYDVIPGSGSQREPVPEHGIPRTTGSEQPAAAADVPSGTPASPGQNLTQPNETGYKVDYGPVTNAPLQPRPVQTERITQPSQLPPNVSETAARNLDRAAAFKRASADRKELAAQAAGFGPGAGKADLDQANDFTAQAKQMRESINEQAKATTEEKNLRRGAAGTTELQKLQINEGEKTYAGIKAAASQYERDIKPYNDLSRSVLSDPTMFTGFGSNLSINLNRARAVFGDQKAAEMQSALQKVTASTVLGQINTQKDQMQEAGANSSRIFSQQVDLVTKAAPAIENTLGGNRFLIEVSTRMGDLSSKIAQLARDYKSNPNGPGYLDAGFDQKIADYMKNNPVFSAKELSHPEILGAPTVPPAMQGDKFQIISWGRQLGLKAGDPIRFPDGQIRAIP